MAIIRKLRVYPDPILHQVSVPVDFDSEPDLPNLIDDMFITMEVASGVGLAAIQVGIPKRIIVIDADDDQYVLINPVIVESIGEQDYKEGCLSVPGVHETRTRAKVIGVEYINGLGETVKRAFSDLEAFCIQHEIDHLDGKVFIDEYSPLKTKRARAKITKTLRQIKGDVIKQKAY